MKTKINAVEEIKATETTTANVPKSKKIKTLANCTPKEFAVQTAKIAHRVKNYTAKIKEYKESLDENGEGASLSNALEILSFICGGNIDETMALCGELCFMDGETFANLDPENGDPDGIAAVVEVFRSGKCISFFSTAYSIGKLTKLL